MITEDYITSNQSYAIPQIISMVDPANGQKLSTYSYKIDDPEKELNTFNSQLSHTFISRCHLIEKVVPTYYVYTSIWFLILVAWCAATFYVRKRHALYLQKTLTLIPACKVFESMITGFYLDACPWVQNENPSEKYLDMARISIITITYTIFLALLFLVSKGWNTMIF